MARCATLVTCHSTFAPSHHRAVTFPMSTLRGRRKREGAPRCSATESRGRIRKYQINHAKSLLSGGRAYIIPASTFGYLALRFSFRLAGSVSFNFLPLELLCRRGEHLESFYYGLGDLLFRRNAKHSCGLGNYLCALYAWE